MDAAQRFIFAGPSSISTRRRSTRATHHDSRHQRPPGDTPYHPPLDTPPTPPITPTPTPNTCTGLTSDIKVGDVYKSLQREKRALRRREKAKRRLKSVLHSVRLITRLRLSSSTASVSRGL